MDLDQTQQIVTDAMKAARDENGYSFEGMTSKAIAEDLIKLCEPLNNSEADHVEDAVINFFEDEATCQHGFLVGCPIC